MTAENSACRPPIPRALPAHFLNSKQVCHLPAGISHRKRRSVSKIRSKTAAWGLHASKARVLAGWACAWAMWPQRCEAVCGVHQHLCLCLRKMDSSSSPVCHSLKTISDSELLSKSTNPFNLKDELCRVQVFKKQDSLDGATCWDGASKSKTRRQPSGGSLNNPSVQQCHLAWTLFPLLWNG